MKAQLSDVLLSFVVWPSVLLPFEASGIAAHSDVPVDDDGAVALASALSSSVLYGLSAHEGNYLVQRSHFFKYPSN
jgi:hypothetical protein